MEELPDVETNQFKTFCDEAKLKSGRIVKLTNALKATHITAKAPHAEASPKIPHANKGDQKAAANKSNNLTVELDVPEKSLSHSSFVAFATYYDNKGTPSEAVVKSPLKASDNPRLLREWDLLLSLHRKSPNSVVEPKHYIEGWRDGCDAIVMEKGVSTLEKHMKKPLNIIEMISVAYKLLESVCSLHDLQYVW